MDALRDFFSSWNIDPVGLALALAAFLAFCWKSMNSDSFRRITGSVGVRWGIVLKMIIYSLVLILLLGIFSIIHLAFGTLGTTLALLFSFIALVLYFVYKILSSGRVEVDTPEEGKILATGKGSKVSIKKSSESRSSSSQYVVGERPKPETKEAWSRKDSELDIKV